MTAPSADRIKAVVDKLTRDEARILAYYAAGESIAEVAASTRIDLQAVAHVIDTTARRDRGYAQKLAVAWQATHPGERAVAAPSPIPAPPRLAPVPAPAPAADTDPIDVTDLLRRAIASDAPKLLRLAEKIGELIDQLDAQVAEYETSKELRAEAEQLEARLAEIREQLGAKRTAPADPGGPDSKAVRAWAAENDVECPAFGRIPAGVLAAYTAAMNR